MFKIGDKVVWVTPYKENKIGDVGFITGARGCSEHDETLIQVDGLFCFYMRVRHAPPEQPIAPLPEPQARVVAKKKVVEKIPLHVQLNAKLDKQYPRRSYSTNDTVHVKDGHAYVTVHAVCFSFLWGKSFDEFFSALQHKTVKFEDDVKASSEYYRYIDWVINKSPFNTSLLSTDTKKAFDENGVYFNCDKPLSQVIASAVALREGHEMWQKLEMFSWLLDKGYSGSVAYLISYWIEKKEDKFVKYVVNANHLAVQFSSNFSSLCQFFVKGFPPTKEKSAKESTTHYEINTAICTQGYVGGNYHAFFKSIPTSSSPKKYDWEYCPSYSEKDILNAADVLTVKLGEMG